MITSRAPAAEFLGALLLTATVVGSGIMGERLANGNMAVALLANTGATVAVLAALISTLGPISGGHFNPVITLVAFLTDSSRLRPMAWATAAVGLYAIWDYERAASRARPHRPPSEQP
jgi:glycerol uptake facilitator-like aquaporin